MTSSRHPRWAWRPLTMLLGAICLVLAVSASAVGAAPRHPHSTTHARSSGAIATSARVLPRPLRAAAKRERQFCMWGVAVKTLVEHDKPPRRCALPDQPAPGAPHWVEFLNTPLPGQPALFAKPEE